MQPKFLTFLIQVVPEAFCQTGRMTLGLLCFSILLVLSILLTLFLWQVFLTEISQGLFSFRLKFRWEIEKGNKMGK